MQDNCGIGSSEENAVATLRVNGQERTFDGDPSMPLLWYLRDELGLTGTKFGCGAALCGNCTVHVDGNAVRSCVTPMSELAGKSVVTIEGLSPKGDHPVQVAWRDQGVPQCGYCQTGQIMQRRGLPGEDAGTHRRADHRGDVRQSLPLRLLSAHPRGRARRGSGGLTMTELNTHTRTKIANVSRRGLLKGVAATGGLVLAAQFPVVRGALADYPTGGTAMPNGVVNNPKVFVSIGGDGTVTIVAARAEMGNGAARTALPMMLADELEADWAKVRVVQSPGDERTYGNQDTDGSRSVRHWIQPMRQCGAAARAMLEQAAAAEWKVDVKEVEAQLHEVVHKPTGRKLGYGQLAAAAAGLPVPAADKIKLKEESAFRYIGKGTVRISDLFDITTGKAIYGQDVRLPGMKFAVIARPPVVGGKVASVDTSAAMKVPGVEKIVTLQPTPAPYKFGPLGGVAVIASSTWAALKGREALKIVWDDGPNKAHDFKAYREQLEAAVKKPGKVERNVGDVDKALASAAKVVTAEYYAPHLHHATMEPPAAAARMNHGKWEILGAGAEPRCGPRRRGRGAGRLPGRGHHAADAARRRLRPQVQVRLRHRGGVPVQRAGRHGREGGVDARGRRAPRLLPHRNGGPVRGRARRQEQGDRLAPPQRGAPPSCPRSRPIRSIPSTSSWAWAGWTRRSTCPTSAWRAARRRAMSASAGSGP